MAVKEPAEALAGIYRDPETRLTQAVLDATIRGGRAEALPRLAKALVARVETEAPALERSLVEARWLAGREAAERELVGLSREHGVSLRLGGRPAVRRRRGCQQFSSTMRTGTALRR